MNSFTLSTMEDMVYFCSVWEEGEYWIVASIKILSCFRCENPFPKN
jgi:hypothetical protein